MIKITNGEKLKEIFPNIIKYGNILIDDTGALQKNILFDDTWWNTEYKEPAIRNCSGCKYSKDNHRAGTEECHLCMWENQYTPTTKNDLAQERYQDLIDYFGDKETAKTILEDKKEFKAWLERVKWHVKRADELARELEQLKPTTKNEAKYCDRNICLKNEYNNIGCEDCEVTKSQEPTTKNDLGVESLIPHLEPDNCGNYVIQSIPVKLNITEIKKHQSDFSDLEQEPIIDKIRADIENDWQLKKYPSSPFSCGLRRAIEIIDKYKAKTEVEDESTN